ncbi:MAG: amidohydrolase family protein [Candidatus Poribacteria bacterium]|nr:amidohydrolase family protein [Candidatus Poribacteria bacterium]
MTNSQARRRVGQDANGAPVCVEWSGETLARVSPAPQDALTKNGALRILPGLCDIQINGYAGVNFNSPTVQPEQLLRMARRVWASGAPLFCPTVITGSRERMRRSIQTIRAAARQDPLFGQSAFGIHVEGPYISPEDGPRGAHPKQHVRPPDWDEFRQWQEDAEGEIRILTLSPEWDAPQFIERAVDAGVAAAIGHTNADARQLNAAVEAGAKISTHLGNGAHATLPRHPNYIWEQLGDDRLWASFIADGHHLPPKTLCCMIRAKTLQRSVLVSDAVWLADMPPGRYEGADGQPLDKLANGRVQLADTPYLAGAALPLLRGVENAVRYAGLTLNEAAQLASTNPMRFLNGGSSALEAGAPANLTIIEWDAQNAQARVLETVLNGETVYRNETLTPNAKDIS